MSSQPKTGQPGGSAAPDLQVYLLGPPKVEWAGRFLAIPRRQARALLYRLAIELEPIPREQLCFLFWADTPESTARRHLSHLLTHLRRALPVPDVLLTVDDHITLDSQRAWSDTVAFEQLYATPEPQPCIEVLQDAVDLYRGPLLAGFSLPTSPEFDAWAAQERRIWERSYLEALAALIEEETARRAYEEAIVYAQRYLEADDLAEEVHRQLIQLYAAAGDRSAALRQFERCAAALERELGVSPLPETRATYQAILEGRSPSLQRPAARLAWTTLPSLDVPLVGRNEPLERLARGYTRARTGHGGVILISGEAGIGKSRLMQGFTTRLEDQALVLMGAGQPSVQATPYHPITQALRSTLDLQPVTPDLQPMWLAETSRLLPELRTLYPDLPPPLRAEPDEARVRLFEALYRFTHGLTAGPQPVLLCLDDLHWADDATLDWIAYLGPRLQNSRLVLLASYRSEEAHAVAELRHTLIRLGVLSELRLSGLDTAAVLELLHCAVGTVPADEVVADQLQKATGGNPFFLLETMRALVEAGQPVEDLAEAEELPLPDTVREVVETRLQRLTPKSRQVLEAGAVLDAPVDFELVGLVAGRREMETMDGLDELVARQLLVEHDSGYRFQHELVRRAVEATLSPMRRQLLHRRAGRALEQLEPDVVAALAHHFDAGGEAEKALQYYTRAAHRAEELFAWREAERHQTRILALLDRLDPDCSNPDCLARRGQVLADRAHLRFLQGRLAERDADLAALTTLAEASGDENLHLQALIHRTRYLNLDAQYEKAIATAEEGLALADRLHDEPVRSRLLAQVGFAHYFLGQPRPALTALESALAVAGEEADPEMRGRITHILGYVYFHLGNYARSLDYQQEAYACHQAVGDHNRVAWDGLDIGALHLEMGHFAEAQQYLTESLALARRIGARPAEAYGVNLLGCWNLHRGDYAAALDRFQQALLMQEELRSEHGCVAAELGTGLASYHLGDLLQARRWLESAVERARSIGHRRRLAEVLVGLGLVETAAGQPSAAHRCLSEAVGVARDSECRENLAAGLATLARTERQEGDPASAPSPRSGQALAHAREAVRVAQESALPVCEMWGEMEAGLVLLTQGKVEAALEHTERAVALSPRAHEGWIGTEEVHHAHALVLRAMGRLEATDEHGRRAEAIVEAKADRIPDPETRRRYLESRH